MKNLLLTTVFLSAFFFAKAQDTILKTDQTEVSAKVMEITTDEVKFKYFNRLDGPTYTLKKSEVFVIIYKDGTREKFGQSTSPAKPLPVSSAYSTIPASYSTTSSAVMEEKRSGWTYGLGYTTPGNAFGEAHGITASSGFYFVSRHRTIGGLIDLDYLYFFGDAPLQYALVSLSGLARFSDHSRFYMGSGGGYAATSISVPTYDRYGIKTIKKIGSDDFGGKVFMGYGLVRLTLIWPSLQSSASLITIGFYTNPFR